MRAISMRATSIALLACASALPPAAQESGLDLAAARAAAQDAIDALRERSGVPGASFAVVLPDGTTVEVAAGLADLEEERPLEPGARMLSGSTGKTFVAALALALDRDGKLSLDDPIDEWLGDEPWFGRLPNAGAGITLRQLLDHTSGIHEYYLQPAFRTVLAEGPRAERTVPDLLEFVFDLEPLFVPGEGWSYADTNYLLAGLILEEAGGAPFYDQVEERFLEPLGLEDTMGSTRPDLPGLVPGYTTERNYFGLPRKLHVEDGHYLDPSFEWCGGGFLSNARDLAVWSKALFSGELLGQDALEEMLVTHPAGIGTQHGYGLAAQVFPGEEGALGELRGHTGFFPGYLNAMGWFPDVDLAAALQVNTDDTRVFPRYISFELVDLARAVLEAAGTGGDHPAGTEEG